MAAKIAWNGAKSLYIFFLNIGSTYTLAMQTQNSFKKNHLFGWLHKFDP